MPCFSPTSSSDGGSDTMAKDPKPKRLTHIDAAGSTRMVDVSEKPPTDRRAVSEGFVRLSPGTMALIAEGRLPKGNAIEVARLAGIMAAKKTADLIPLCHPLQLSHVDVQAQPQARGVKFVATVS